MNGAKCIIAKTSCCFFLLGLVGGGALAQSEPVTQSLKLSAQSEPVVRMNEVILTHAELDAYLGRLPEEDRPQAVSSMERIDKLLQNLLLQKALYEAGKDSDLLDDPTLTFRALYAVADILAKETMNRRVEARLLDSYDQRAKELFLANSDQFRPSPTYSFTHILVSTTDRSESDAMRQILEVHEKFHEGQPLDELVNAYSEDGASAKSGGKYVRRSLDQLDRNFARALQELESPGDVSGPVRSRFGWHIIRLDERHQPGNAKWEDIREEAVAKARRQHEKRIRETYVTELLDPNAIEVVPGSIEKLQRRHGFDPSARRNVNSD